ncbi:hypothetical protein DMH12_15370 [Streptomyces sp. WAC 04229]|uniref:hypothetical protein n=1 Tax=Streptomyces sp. WAC 04229 TaxID=2203206 RepID=UPI000F73EE5C|nr:hypothetical protein [Streptomyces sp. WAC 04229]RSN55597.1 hypothetical protein DMH12_15370 [Streptomyces sp. WAC 04229]
MGLDLRVGREEGRLPNDPWPSWSYLGFGQFRRRLAQHIGVDLDQMHGFGGDGDWTTVPSPLRHLLDHSDCDGELTPQQASELAPALQRALQEIGCGVEPGDDPGWDYDQKTGAELVQLLELCARESVPVEFC